MPTLTQPARCNHMARTGTTFERPSQTCFTPDQGTDWRSNACDACQEKHPSFAGGSLPAGAVPDPPPACLSSEANGPIWSRRLPTPTSFELIPCTNTTHQAPLGLADALPCWPKTLDGHPLWWGWGPEQGGPQLPAPGGERIKSAPVPRFPGRG